MGLPCRFGSFEIFKPRDENTGRAGPSVGRDDIRLQMLDYVISTFYPEIQAAHPGDPVQRHAAFFREVSGAVPRGWALGVLPSESPPVPNPHHHPLAWSRASFSDAADQGPGMDPHLSSLKELCRDLGGSQGWQVLGLPHGACAHSGPHHTPLSLLIWGTC